MAITIGTDIASKAFINNPINISVTSNRNIDFDNAISSVNDNGGFVRLVVASISDTGALLVVGDTVYLSGFATADMLYLNGQYGTVTGIAGTYEITTTIPYVSNGAVTGSPIYTRVNNNFEIRSTVKLKIGSGGTYATVSGPTSQSIDGTNFDFEISAYLKMLYDQNIGSDEHTTLSLPVTTEIVEKDLPIGQITFTEYFDDPNGLQTTGDSRDGTAQYVHDGVYMPNDLIDKSDLIVSGTYAIAWYGLSLIRLTRNVCNIYFSVDFVALSTDLKFRVEYWNKSGVNYYTGGGTFTNNKKTIYQALSAQLALDIDYVKVKIYDTSLTQLKQSKTVYLSETSCPAYLVKYKNDLGGWEYINCRLIDRSIEVKKSSWEKKLDFPYTSTDYGSKNIIQRSDDVLDLETGTLVNEDQIASFFESRFVEVYDVDNAINMSGQLLDNKTIIKTSDSINARFKIRLNRRR